MPEPRWVKPVLSPTREIIIFRSHQGLSGEIEPGDKVLVDAEGDDLKFDVEKGAASQEVSRAAADEMLAASLSEP